jgi:nitrate reductase cytochrome c-type subunit
LNNKALYIDLLHSNSTSHTQNAAECISLSFLSYYSEFSLLLCSECHTALFSDTFSSHVKSHFKQHAEKEKQQELLSQILSFSLYTASETFALIQQSSMILFAFSELDIHKNAFSCNLCHLVLLNKENMKRHCSKNHASDFKHTVTSSILVQSLRKNRFFFQVQARSISTVSNIASDVQNIDSKHKTKWFCMQNQSEQLFIGSRRPEQSLA